MPRNSPSTMPSGTLSSNEAKDKPSKDTQAFANENNEVSKFSKESKNYFKLLLRRGRLDLLAGPITESFGVIIGVILLWYGGTEVLMHQYFSTSIPQQNNSNYNTKAFSDRTCQ